MNKPLLCSLVLLLALNWLSAQSPIYHWLTKSDGARNDRYDRYSNKHFEVDKAGNIYILERMSDQVNFGDTTLYGSAEAGPYSFVKYNREGQFEWARKLVGLDNGEEYESWGWINSLQFDAKGNALICGEFQSPEMYLGIGDTLRNQCRGAFCNVAFLASFTPQGQILWTTQYHALAVETDSPYLYAGADSPIVGLDAQENRLLVFNVLADTFVLGGQRLVYPQNEYNLLFARLNALNQLEEVSTLNMENGSCVPLAVVAQSDGSALLFVEADVDMTFRNEQGFSFTTASDDPAVDELFVLFKYGSEGQVLWAKELQGEYTEAEFCSDGLGNTYILGYFETSLSWDGQTLINNPEAYGGFILKIDQAGKIIWKKIYENGAQIAINAKLSNITPDGGLLAPIFIIAPDENTATTFEGRTVQPVLFEYTSIIGHYSPLGVLDTFVPLPAEDEGIFVVTDLRYAPGGKLYGIFQTLEVDTLRLGAYTLPVVDETSKILACFSLFDLPPRFKSPPALRNTTKTTKNLLIIRTYPNPVEQQLSAAWALQEQPSQLILRDAQGKVLQQHQVAAHVSQQNLDLSAYPSGWYVLEWRCGALRDIRKVLKK